ncbi:DUF1631 family protein [Massilia sp. DWR3-1-1]|uniref:DUF1631 family protein n=1 Tax=Massilia sp. DWR3-1-1 TaxID=2804559 RepID=UPI003CE6B6F2
MNNLVELATKHLGEDLTALCTRLSAAFLAIDDPAIDAATVYHRVRAGNLLKSQSYAYIHLAGAAIDSLMRKEALALRPQLPGAAASAGALSLVPMEEMDLSVTFATLSRPFEAACAESLATLNVRLGFLLERDTLRVGQNPFRPDLVLLALHQAWCEFSPEADTHALFAPLLKPGVAPDFAPLYEALNGVLEAGSGQALRIRKTDNAARARAERAGSKAALARQLRQFLADGGDFDDDTPLVPDLPSMPQGNGGWRPSGADGFEAAPTHAAPMHAGSTHAGSTHAGSTHAGSIHAGSTHPGSIHAGAMSTGSLQAGPLHAGSGHAGPGHAGSMHAGPVHAGSTHPGPAVAAAFHAAPSLVASTHDARHHPAAQGGAGFAPQAGGIEHAGAPLAPGADHHAAFAAAPQAPHASLLELLARLPGLSPVATTATAPVETGAGAQQVFYLPRLRQAMPAGALNRGDATTLDLLSRIFDTVYLDDAIPQPTRELIQYLQAPVLKAALLDKEFFYQDNHPARRMIDLMSRMGWEQRSADDPLFQAMQRGVERVGRDSDATVTVFAEAVAELETTLAAQEQAAAATFAAPIAAALKQEKVSAATKSARNAIALRVGGGQLATVVEAFLQRKWTSVLTIAYSVETEKPGAVGSATRTMDDLIWSVKPKITVEQRKQLIARLPGLLTTLNKWLDIIKWQDAERLQFFAELAECHASIVRAPIDLSPERQLEVALEAAQQDALRRVEKEQAQAAAELVEAAAAEQDPVQADIDGLERGMWLEFAEADSAARTVKLAWISPLRTLFIFSTGERKEAFSLGIEPLAAAWRDGRVRIVRQDGMVAQALAAALAVNDAAAAAA